MSSCSMWSSKRQERIFTHKTILDKRYAVLQQLHRADDLLIVCVTQNDCCIWKKRTPKSFISSPKFPPKLKMDDFFRLTEISKVFELYEWLHRGLFRKQPREMSEDDSNFIEVSGTLLNLLNWSPKRLHPSNVLSRWCFLQDLFLQCF